MKNIQHMTLLWFCCMEDVQEIFLCWIKTSFLLQLDEPERGQTV